MVTIAKLAKQSDSAPWSITDFFFARILGGMTTSSLVAVGSVNHQYASKKRFTIGRNDPCMKLMLRIGRNRKPLDRKHV
jgi:hypothetical protein